MSKKLPIVPLVIVILAVWGSTVWGAPVLSDLQAESGPALCADYDGMSSEVTVHFWWNYQPGDNLWGRKCPFPPCDGPWFEIPCKKPPNCGQRSYEINETGNWEFRTSRDGHYGPSLFFSTPAPGCPPPGECPISRECEENPTPIPAPWSDIRITQVAVDPSHPNPGDTLQITVSFIKDGNISSPVSTELKLEVFGPGWGEQVNEVQISVPWQQIATEIFTYTLPSDTISGALHVAEATLATYQDEQNPNNNSRSKRFCVGPGQCPWVFLPKVCYQWPLPAPTPENCRIESLSFNFRPSPPRVVARIKGCDKEREMALSFIANSDLGFLKDPYPPNTITNEEKKVEWRIEEDGEFSVGVVSSGVDPAVCTATLTMNGVKVDRKIATWAP